jgi:pseudaminic acid biosynthesis-associated methylase
MKKFKTEQEDFWKGGFGDQYIQRNQSHELLAANLHFFSHVLADRETVDSVLELGCNVGMNIRALKLLLPSSEITGIEINEKAALEASTIANDVKILNESILNHESSGTYDLVFTKGVLIHISPDELPLVYKKMAEASSRYVMIAEYYNPTPVGIDYRGHENRLFKRDFAGEFLQVNPEFKLVDYRFHYKKAVNFSQDDITWFLMERK